MTKNSNNFSGIIIAIGWQKKIKEILCVFGECHRTNNIAEIFHSKLQGDINKRNTSILRLLVKF